MKKIVIVGNPNCGKTTLFNALTGARQKVGNWSGVTVDIKLGKIKLDDQEVELIDLPGLYSLTVSDSGSIDERIATEYILNEKPDLIINVLDTANLERNLYLTTQLLEMNVPILIAANMIDVAKSKQIYFHADKLEKELNAKVIPVIGRKAVGIETLKKAIFDSIDSHYKQPIIIKDYPALQTNIQTLKTLLPNHNNQPSWFWLKLLDGDLFAIEELSDEEKNKVNQYLKGLSLKVTLASERYAWIKNLYQQVAISKNQKRHRLTEWFDKLAMNQYVGLPFFFFIMYLMFEFSIGLGSALSPLFDDASDIIFVQGTLHLGLYLGLPAWLITVLANGVGLGINTVLSFVPQIACLFLFLSFLEDSGYMARAAFVMDRLMQAIGLPGKAFVPLIVGFGCNVPSVMATRTLESRRDRLLTIMMAPFMSCGARLAIFAVFAAAFFPTGGGLIVFLLYVIGIVAAIVTGLLIKLIVLKGSAEPFIMELPVYHLPNTRTIFAHTWRRLKGFMFRAGRVIIPICIVIGTLNSVTISGKISIDGSRESVLSEIGRTITPVFYPIGVTDENWPATVGLITGTLAKEVVVGTLNTLYSQNSQSLSDIQREGFNLLGSLKEAGLSTIDNLKNIDQSFKNPFIANEGDKDISNTAMGEMVKQFSSTAAVFAYLLFVLLYVPCVATIGAMAREASQSWAWLSVLWSTVLAYAVAVFAYQIPLLATSTFSASVSITLSLAAVVITLYIMRYFGLRIRYNPQIGTCKSGCS
ncbi:Fe(2+) transporter permease subunit FeoB [Thiotrichales bacterium 19S9-12]|nr:Fe(2+) transporter permease subunit FeoB [Thiotrichales bacterium 19S9-11]MCF6811271.1 Fe(2+) transporter permease subunit FeoB [Thiotrichales bacterium 19S9-12]